MRITTFILMLSLFRPCHAYAQSWADQIPAVIQQEKASIVISDYFADKSLFDQINHLRNQMFELEHLPFDTTGQYTRAKKQLNQFLRFTSQNISIIPVRDNNGGVTSTKTLNFEDSGHMKISIHQINTLLVDQIFERNIKNCVNTWFQDENKNQTFRLNGLSAVAAMKLLITFEKSENMVKLMWKYVSSYTLRTLPENMVRSDGQNRISRLKKP